MVTKKTAAHKPAHKSDPPVEKYQPAPPAPPPETQHPLSQDQLRGILLTLYRSGVVPDISHLNDAEKKDLRHLVEADSQAEIIFRYPEREKLREYLRKHLG